MRQTERRAGTPRLRRAPRPSSDLPMAIICKEAPEEVMDTCLLRLGVEARLEQVPTLAEAMRRCLKGRVDILLVNLLDFDPAELTALAAFREMMPASLIVGVASRQMGPALVGAGVVDEVFVPHAPGPAPRDPQA